MCEWKYKKVFRAHVCSFSLLNKIKQEKLSYGENFLRQKHRKNNPSSCQQKWNNFGFCASCGSLGFNERVVLLFAAVTSLYLNINEIELSKRSFPKTTESTPSLQLGWVSAAIVMWTRCFLRTLSISLCKAKHLENFFLEKHFNYKLADIVQNLNFQKAQKSQKLLHWRNSLKLMKTMKIGKRRWDKTPPQAID